MDVQLIIILYMYDGVLETNKHVTVKVNLLRYEQINKPMNRKKSNSDHQDKLFTVKPKFSYKSNNNT